MREQSIYYKINIIDEPISFEDGRSFDRTAIIEKWKGPSKLSSSRLAAPRLEQVYASIYNKEHINLSYCYLKDFSMKKYRSIYELSDSMPVPMESFQATHSFFESEFGTDFSYAVFEGQASSFAYSIFNLGNVNFNYIKCTNNLNFSHCEYNLEDLTYKFAEFEGGDVRFTSARFDCDNILFINTNFGEGSVNFRQADFVYSDCNFQYARFDKSEVSFDKSIFRGKHIDFRKVEFGTGRTDFKRVDFGDGDINFNDSEFKEGKISFKNSIFGRGEKSFERINFGQNEVYFDSCIFKEGLLSFKDSSFGILSLKDCNLEGHCDLRIHKGEKIDLSYSVLKDVLDIQAGGNSLVELKTLKIEEVKNMGKIFISWRENKAYDLINSQRYSSSQSKSIQFHLLKDSFHQNGKFNSEDFAYVAFKRFKMKAERERAQKKGGLVAVKGNLMYLFEWLVFDKVGLFATAPLRVFTSMLFVLAGFALLYIILPYFSNADIVSAVGDPDHLNSIEKSFYHSAITFFTIGYGDFYPSGHIRWLSAVEGWTGVFLMSYFTVAFVRKILR